MIQQFVVDAFTDKVFSGNPAAVCVLQSWLSDELMQNIAFENNLAETAFLVLEGDKYHIRWFTPTVEVVLCGHATLAASHVLFNHLDYAGSEIRYTSLSGILKVTRSNSLLTLNFPVDNYTAVPITAEMKKCFPIEPLEAYKGNTDFMFVFSSQEEIQNMQPDFDAINKLDSRGAIITARGKTVDFVSRFFGPQTGILEDPVTGSAHTTLTPYWAGKLGKNELSALQLSQRGGTLFCKLDNDRVFISGNATTYSTAQINIPI